MTTDLQQKAGSIAIIGVPNAGKSTLVNALVGSKIAIVTPKAQTTRTRLCGIITEGNTQLVLIDTPGIFKQASTKLDKMMLEHAWGAIGEADAVVYLVDATAWKNEANQRLRERLKDIHKPIVVVLNKVDLMAKLKLLPIVTQLETEKLTDQYFFISALKNDGLEDLKKHLISYLPVAPWFYEADQLADAPTRYLAEEITREKLFLNVHKEIPYALTVQTEQWKKADKGNSIHIHQQIILDRESQKPIILGKNGEMLKKIGTLARADIAELIGVPVHLFLHVKVVENWQQKEQFFNDHST
jgi:GTP-binding protein Era